MSSPTASTVSALRCQACGKLEAGPRQLCPACHSPALESTAVPGEGALVSWTMIRRAPARFKELAPYAVCLVDLGQGLLVTGRLAKEMPEPAIGARVHCTGQEQGVAIFAGEP